MEERITIILNNTYTTSAVQQRIALLKEFLEYAFYGAGGGQPSLELFDIFVREKEVQEGHAQAVREWGTPLWGAITPGTFYQTLNTLLASFKDIPVLTLYTPVKFPLADIAALGSRIRGLVGKTVLIDDHIDPDLSIGCAFVLQGVYHEYGLPFFVGRKREELMTLITRYGER